jgi:hypothetical protein
MKRRAKPKERPHRSYDIKKDIKPEWLAALGAVCVAWNDIEGALDVALCVVLEVPAPLWLDVSSRIQGIDGKIALIKKAARVHFALPDSVADLVEVSMAAIHEHKTYRDGVIHARILDPDSEIAPSYASKGSEFEAIVSQAALDGPFDRLACLQLEIEDVLLILHHREITIRHVKRSRVTIGPTINSRTCRSTPTTSEYATRSSAASIISSGTPNSAREGRYSSNRELASILPTFAGLSRMPFLVVLCAT